MAASDEVCGVDAQCAHQQLRQAGRRVALAWAEHHERRSQRRGGGGGRCIADGSGGSVLEQQHELWQQLEEDV